MLRTEYREEYLVKKELRTGGYRIFHDEELHNFSFTSDIIKTIKSRRMR
jgi:DNA-binding transcriptional MerR regulator